METTALTFAEIVAGWHNFYLLLGGASATLVGLLFVALTLRLNRVREAARIDLRAIVSNTFGNFIYVLIVSAVMLIPSQSPQDLGKQLMLLGSIGLLYTISQFREVHRSRQREWGAGTLRLFVLPLIAFVGMVVIALTMLRGQSDGLYWMVTVILILLTTAADNAYRLLVEVAEV
jgi:hypothetical protein